MKRFRAIGLMSGTSLDGLDAVDVIFFQNNNHGKWNFEIKHSKIFRFEENMLKRLKNAFSISADGITALSADLGRFYAEKVNEFLLENAVEKAKIDFIASHGQTIFHQPEKKYTLQIGNGPELAVETHLPTILDFRSKDVALGGNGAPLIPVADFLLFSDYADTFLNLGGFSNFSFQQQGKVYSYDICPVNIVINRLMQQIGKEYDEFGDFGRRGEINQVLLNQLNELSYYSEEGPKSLGWEWVEEQIYPLLSQEIKLQDKVRTLYEHIAFQIGKKLNAIASRSTLVTGGGAKNTFLMERIQANTKGKIIVPDEEIIDFKEAIGFAFLGLLRWTNEINVWSSVTGSKRDSSSGVIIMP